MALMVVPTAEPGCQFREQEDDDSGQEFDWRRIDLRSLRDRFDDLAGQWKEETRFLSSANMISHHTAYQEIITMGLSVVRLIPEDLQASPNHWFIALRKITGECPIQPGGFGSASRMRQAWLQWGRQNSYI